MKFSKPIPYHPDTRTLGPVSMKIWFYLADNKRVKLNHASASLTPGSGWEGLVDLKTRYILDNTTFQIDASLKRPLRLSEYQGLILTKRSIPIQSTLTPEGSVPGMGIPVPIGGAPVIDQIDLTIPDIPHPELITDVYYAGNDESGHPVAVVQATVNLPFTFTEEEIAGITECISISVTDGRTAITEGPEIIEGQYKKRFITGNAPPDVMQKSGVIVTVRSSVAGLLLAEEVSLTFAPSLSYILNIKPSRSLFVTVKDPAHLHAEVFSQDESGTLRQVPDSELHLDLPSGISEFLSVSPITARGVLNAAITQTRPTNLQEIEFSLNASVHEDAVPPQTITVHFNAPASRSIETRFESDKNAISPFLIPDRAILLVRFSTDAPEAPIWTFERAQPDGWLDEPSTPVDYGDGWTAVALKATPPDPEYTGDPPASEDIIITATSGNTRSGPVSVPVLLLKRPTIEADTYQVTLVKGINETVRVQVRIDHGGSESWVFAIDPEKTLKRVNATITGLDDTHAEIAMTEQDSPDERSESLYDSETVIVTASPRSGELSFPLECHIAVIISKEGLFIDTIARRKDTGMYHVPVPNSQMDSSALLDFYYLVLTEDNQIISHTSAITDPSPLDFTTMEDEKTKPYNAAKGSGLTFVSSGVRQLNTPSAVYSVSMIRPIPFDGTPIPVRCRATVQNHAGSEETGYCDFILALETDNVNPGSASWEIEVRRCERIINTMAPEQARPELHTLLSKRKQVLGVEGLVQLRWMIYNRAYRLCLEEAQDYLDAANRYDQIIEALEWVKWAGDLAFNAALGTVVGPFGAIAINHVKGKILGALEAYQMGTPPESFISFDDIKGITEGKLIDPDQLAKLTGERRWLAWGLFAGYHFLKTLIYGDPPNNTVVGAAKETARQLRDEVIADWLNSTVKDHGTKQVSGIIRGGKEETGGKKKPDLTQKKPVPEGKPGDEKAKEEGKTKPDEVKQKEETGKEKESPEGKDKEDKKKPDERQAKEGKKTADEKLKEATSEYDRLKSEYDAIKDKSSKEAKEAAKRRDNARLAMEKAKAESLADKNIADSQKEVDAREKMKFEEGRKEGRNKVNELKDAWENLQKNPDDPAAKKRFSEVCEKVQKDKHAMHVLNDEPHILDGKTRKPGEESPLRRDFNEHWKQTYDNVDRRVKQRIADQLNQNLKPGERPYGPDDIEIAKITNVKDATPRTPDQESTKSTFDRDVTYRKPKQQMRIDPHTGKAVIDMKTGQPVYDPVIDPRTGKPEMEDVKSTNEPVRDVKGNTRTENGKLVEQEGTGSRDIYNQEFYRERHGEYPYKTDASGRVITGPDGKPVIDQAKCNEYAEHMDQTVTDRFHTDAYGGGKEDIGPATRGDMKGKPYKDLEATTRTMETKVYEWYDRAERAMKSGDPKAAGAYKEEGMRQLTKQFKNQIEPVVNKYNELAGYPDPPIARIPENVRAGVEIMNRVGKDGFTPADAEAALAHMGESPRSIIQKMSGILESGQKHMSAGQRQQLHEYLKTLPDE